MKILLCAILVVNAFISIAQTKITSVNISDEIINAYVDRVGELYIHTKSGQIQKFDVNGKLISLFKRSETPTLFDPRDGSRLFAFYRDSRKTEFLSPSFEVTHAAVIDSAFVIDPWLVCTSGDHNLWILDSADHSLKKISPTTSSVLIDVQFPNEPSIKWSGLTYAREYQGFIFFLEEDKAINIFNGMGRWIKSIRSNKLRYFNFLGEEIYYPSKMDLIFVNLFSGEQRKMPLSKACKFALATDERLFLVHTNSIDFFQFQP